MSIHELLPWYTNETLDAEEAARFEQHLSGCETCTKELELLRKVQARLDDRGEVLLSDHPMPQHLMAALATDADDADLEPGVAVEIRRHVALCASCADDAGWALKEAANDHGSAAARRIDAAAAQPRRGFPVRAWSLAAAFLLVALAVPIAFQLGANRSTGKAQLYVVEPTERSGSGPTVVGVSPGSHKVYLMLPLDVGQDAFPLRFEIADHAGKVVYSDDSIGPDDLSEQGLFLFRVVPRRQVPDGGYVARVVTAGGENITEYPLQVIASQGDNP